LPFPEWPLGVVVVSVSVTGLVAAVDLVAGRGAVFACARDRSAAFRGAAG
jgi:hypothetical protein